MVRAGRKLQLVNVGFDVISRLSLRLYVFLWSHVVWLPAFIGPCIVVYFYSKTNKIHQCFKFILFCNHTQHVSDGLSVHHQEFKTVHTAIGVCQTDTAVCLLGRREQYMSLHSPVAVCTVLNSWWWTERPSETCRVWFQNKINLRHSCI